ncbi:PRC-barrel domain-containing protein [Pseudonocardia sp. CA-107938]|uniref:PRC-barrel domain-containing protein n=1 Tax=Pseudonocardia sp. CA-107938 TaxID=3240021 RepID=UPI003D8CB5F0
MRASDLIGRDVVDRDGHRIGVVTDLRCVQDGPLRGAMAAPRLDALLVSPRHSGALLGYQRPSQHGPWLIRAIVERLHRHARLIPWSAVTAHDPQIVVDSSVHDLPTVHRSQAGGEGEQPGARRGE